MSGAAAPALTQSDACLVAALTETWPNPRWMRLDEFIGNYDWLVRGIPTFDEFSYGFPRLIGAGYGEVDGTGPAMRRPRDTRAPWQLGGRPRRKTLGGVLWDVADAAGRSSVRVSRNARIGAWGGCAGWSATTWDEAVKAYVTRHGAAGA